MNLAKTSKPFLVLTGLILVALLLVAWLAIWLIPANRAWLKVVEIPGATELDGELFSKLMDAELIWVERTETDIWLRRIACSSYNVANPETIVKRVGKSAAFDRRLVFELCRSNLGERIIENVDLFNSGNQLIAVRDNRGAGQAQNGVLTCSDGTSVTSLFLPPNCMRSEWKTTVKSSGQPLRPVSADAIPIRDYFPLAMLKPAVMSDWAVVRPFFDAITGTVPHHTFETEVTFKSEPLSIQIIGYADRIAINDRTINLSELGVAERGSLQTAVDGQNIAISFERVCEGEKKTKVNCEFSGTKLKSGLHIFVTAPAGAVLSLRLDLLPSNHSSAPSGPAPTQTAQPVTWSQSNLEVRDIKITCAQKNVPATTPHLLGASAACVAFWDDVQIWPKLPSPRTPPGGTQPPPAATPDPAVDPIKAEPFGLEMDGIAILNDSGQLTPEGFRLGYGDILGFGTSDINSYADYLSRHAGGREIKFTFRPAMQQRMIDVLKRGVPRGKMRPYSRAELIIMDAEGADAGRILGYATTPDRREGGLSHWDMRALSLVKPGDSPFAAHLWKAHDNSAVPGSTFKLVTALAAIQHVLDEDDDTLEDILLGQASAQEMMTYLGWMRAVPGFKGACRPQGATGGFASYNAFPVYDREGNGQIIHCLGNFGQASADSYLLSGNNGCRPGDARRHTGLCEALQKSSNQFFASIALHSGKKALYRMPGATAEHDDELVGVPLVVLTQRLSTTRQMATAPLGLFDALDPKFQVGSVASVPIKLRVMDPQPDQTIFPRVAARSRSQDLAQNGMGQAVDATPTAMAAVAASIATRRVVNPIIAEQAVRPATPHIPLIHFPQGEKARHDALLDALELGMRQVVTRGTGTRIDKGLPATVVQGIHAKTGTADVEIEQKERNGAWVVGFVRAPGGGSGITQDISFACRVVPIPTGRGQGGGSVCGPVINTLLHELHKNGL